MRGGKKCNCRYFSFWFSTGLVTQHTQRIYLFLLVNQHSANVLFPGTKWDKMISPQPLNSPEQEDRSNCWVSSSHAVSCSWLASHFGKVLLFFTGKLCSPCFVFWNSVWWYTIVTVNRHVTLVNLLAYVDLSRGAHRIQGPSNRQLRISEAGGATEKKITVC